MRLPSKVLAEITGLPLHVDYDLDNLTPEQMQDMARLNGDDLAWTAQDLLDRNPELKRLFPHGARHPKFLIAGAANGYPAEDILFFDLHGGEVPREHFRRAGDMMRRVSAISHRSVTGYIPGPANLEKIEQWLASHGFPVDAQQHASGAWLSPTMADRFHSERINTDIDLRARYDHWNAKAFGGLLPELPVEWMKSRVKGGEARATVVRNIDGVRGRYQITPKGIRISQYLATNPEKVDGILLHEMVHVKNYVDNHDDGHGLFFKHARREAAAAAGRDIPVDEDLSGWELAEDAPVAPARQYVAAVAPAEGGKPPILDLYMASAFKTLEPEVRKKLKQFYSERHWQFVQVSLPEFDRFRARRKVDFGAYRIEPALYDKIVAEGKVLGREPAVASAAHLSLEGSSPWEFQTAGRDTRAPERVSAGDDDSPGDQDTSLESMGIVPQEIQGQSLAEPRLVQPSLSRRHASGAHLTPRT